MKVIDLSHATIRHKARELTSSKSNPTSVTFTSIATRSFLSLSNAWQCVNLLGLLSTILPSNWIDFLVIKGKNAMSKYPVVDVLQYPSYCLIWSRAQPFTLLFHKKRIFWSGYRVFEDDWMIHSFRIACQQQHEVAGQFVTSCIHPTWSPYQQSTCDGTLETAVEPYDVIL